MLDPNRFLEPELGDQGAHLTAIGAIGAIGVGRQEAQVQPRQGAARDALGLR